MQNKRHFMTFLLVLLAALTFSTTQSLASCVADPLNGRWTNVDPNTRSLTVVEYQQVCHDVILCPNGRCQPAPKHIAIIKVWGQCHPTDCAWGEAKVYRHSSGWKYADYDQGFAEKRVWLRQTSGGRLEVKTFNHYVDGSGRSDRWDTDRFRKSGS